MRTHLRWPACLSVRKKPLCKYAVSALVFGLGYVLFMRIRAQVWLWTDGCFLAALLMLMLGCWTLVRWLGLFDFTAYSWKRFIRGFLHRTDEKLEEDPLPAYADYLQQPHLLPSAGEPLLCFAVLMIVYLVLVYGFGVR